MNNKHIISISFLVFIFAIFLYQSNNQFLFKDEPFSLSGLGSGKELISDVKEVDIKEITSRLYSFSLQYPNHLSIKEFDEGSGATTFVLEDQKTEQGFQIFVVPYLEEQVTEERFKKDVPSGVRENMKSLQIDGAQANSFYSFNNLLGETFEIWFINGDFLYEVSTIKHLEPWLLEVMENWQFLN